jgi:hypothetical protein
MARPDDKESSKSSDDGQIMRNGREMTDKKEKPRTTVSGATGFTNSAFIKSSNMIGR